jgi:hypothetical protein
MALSGQSLKKAVQDKMAGLLSVTSKAQAIQDESVICSRYGRFAAFVACRVLHLRAVVSVALGSSVPWQLVHVFWTRETDSAYVGRAAAFAASGLSTLGR